ncbi:uncharacterized protein [Haliotis asinina]|uniref:uncharacterized protein isoform X2 n=1 Tax=Haliotis asinina TaxID=109174 RepID=UPI003531B92F
MSNMVAKHMDHTIASSDRVDSSVLEVFKTLAEGNDKARSSATNFLISHLQTQQKQSEICSDLSYSLQRLIKGLSSNRKWARLGFSVALTQVLRVFEVVTVQLVLEGIDKHLLVTQHDSKNEAGAVYMGKAFGYLALIQSGKLLQGESGQVSEVVEKLRHISTQKSYLQPICYQGLVCLIAKVSGEVFTEQVFPHLQADLSQGWDKCSPNTLLLVYCAVKFHKKRLTKALMTEHWGSMKLFGEKNYANMLQVLQKSAESHPVIHSIVDVMVDDLAASGRDVVGFFNQIVLKLLEGSHSHKYLGLHLYLKIVPTITDPDQLRKTLNPAIMNLLVFNLPRKDSIAHTTCRSIVGSLVDKLGSGDSAMDMAILECFTRTPGSLNFDNTTNTHTVSAILHKISEEALKQHAASLMAYINGTDKTFPAGFEKQAVSQFCTMLTSPIVKDSKWRLSVLQFLLARSFFKVTCPNSSLPQCDVLANQPNNAVRQCLRANFYKALNTLATSNPEKCSKTEHFRSYVGLVHDVVKYTDTLIKSPDSVTLQLETGRQEKILKVWDQVVEMTAQIEKKRKKEKVISHHDAFLLLFTYVGLSLFSEPESVVSVMEDLCVCYEKATQKKKVKHDNEPAWMEVVTEVLVNMMSQRSNLTRIIANTVFTALQSNLTREALSIIITALQPSKSIDEEEDLLTFENDAEMDADSVTDDNMTTDDNNEESSDEDSEEESSTDEEPEVSVDEALRETLKVALGKAAVGNDEDEDEEESESDLSDSEMIKLDPKLAEVFRSQLKERSQEKREKRRQILLFKTRLLDLVETVVKGQLLSSHAMDVVELLLLLMEVGHRRMDDKELGDRAFVIFRRLVKKQKEIKTDPEFDETSAFVMIDNLIHYSRKAHRQDLVKAISDACLVIIRLLIHQKLDAPQSVKTRSRSKTDAVSVDKEEGYLQEVLDIVRSSLSDFLYRRDHRLHMVFFHNMLNKHPMMFWPLTDVLLQSLNDAKVKVHSKTQACSLLSALFSAGKNLPREVGDDNWEQFSSALSKTLHTLLLSLSVDSIKPKFTLELLHIVVRLSIIHPDTARQVATNEVTEKLTGLKSHFNKDARSMCNRLLNFTRQKTSKKQKKRKNKSNNSGQHNGDVVENLAELTLVNGAGENNSSDLLSDSVTSTMSVESDSPRKRRSSDEVDDASAGSSRKKKKTGKKQK